MLIISSIILFLSILFSAAFGFYTNLNDNFLTSEKKLENRSITFLIFSVSECASLMMWVLMIHPSVVSGLKHIKMNSGTRQSQSGPDLKLVPSPMYSFSGTSSKNEGLVGDFLGAPEINLEMSQKIPVSDENK
jgi:hypothetical protein